MPLIVKQIKRDATELNDDDIITVKIISCDYLYAKIIYPFADANIEFFHKLSKELETIYPESAAIPMIIGYTYYINQEDDDIAFENCNKALSIDRNFWLASWLCADILLGQKN